MILFILHNFVNAQILRKVNIPYPMLARLPVLIKKVAVSLSVSGF